MDDGLPARATAARARSTAATSSRRRRRRGSRVLFENTELGKDMSRGLSRAIAGKGPKIVASESYEYTATDVASQIAKLKASGADTLMLFATPKFMIQAIVAAHKLGWKPQLYIASVSIEPTIMAIARVERARADAGRAVDRVRQEPERPGLGEGPDGGALPHDPEAVRPVGEADRRLQLVRHDRRLDDGRDAEAGGQEPDARRAARARRGASTRRRTRSCSPASASARRRRTTSRSTPSTSTATTTGSGSARRARSPTG